MTIVVLEHFEVEEVLSRIEAALHLGKLLPIFQPIQSTVAAPDAPHSGKQALSIADIGFDIGQVLPRAELLPARHQLLPGETGEERPGAPGALVARLPLTPHAKIFQSAAIVKNLKVDQVLTCFELVPFLLKVAPL